MELHKFELAPLPHLIGNRGTKVVLAHPETINILNEKGSFANEGVRTVVGLLVDDALSRGDGLTEDELGDRTGYAINTIRGLMNAYHLIEGWRVEKIKPGWWVAVKGPSALEIENLLYDVARTDASVKQALCDSEHIRDCEERCRRVVERCTGFSASAINAMNLTDLEIAFERLRSPVSAESEGA